MAIRVTLVYSWSGVGQKLVAASETHWYLPGVASLRDAIPPAIVMANKRTALVAGNVSLLVMRISDDAVRGDSLPVLPDSQPHGMVSLNSESGLAKTVSSDQPNSVMLVKAQNTAITKKHIFFCGIPDVVIQTAPAGPNLDSIINWRAHWSRFRNHMIGQQQDVGGGLAPIWGFRARALADATARRPIVNWTQSAGAPTNLIMHIPTGQLVRNVGDVVQIRGVTMLVPGTPRPLGQWRIQSKTVSGGNDLFELRSSSAYDAAAIDQPGTAEPVSYAYFAYTDLQPAGQTTRKRGVASAAARGKSSRRSRRLVS